jgi:2-methylisocitrate lyase-like PEP mutase family enzyme
MPPSAVLRGLIDGGDTIVAPGAYDGLSARLVERSGFRAIYVGLEVIARSAGMPDVALLAMSEAVDRLQQMADAVALPLIADAGDGFGNAIRVQRTVRAYERAGVAAFQLGDRAPGKRHRGDKSLVPMPEMMQKIRAARDGARDPGLVLVARTEALTAEGFEGALIRAEAYREAGADALFIEGPRSEDQLVEIARRLPGLKLLDLGRDSQVPPLPSEQLKELGFGLVVLPGDLQRAAAWAFGEALAAIRRDGTSEGAKERLISLQELEEAMGAAAHRDREKTYSS